MDICANKNIDLHNYIIIIHSFGFIPIVVYNNRCTFYSCNDYETFSLPMQNEQNDKFTWMILVDVNDLDYHYQHIMVIMA